MTTEAKVHLLTAGGRVACNTRLARATTRERGEVTCAICKGVGVRLRRDPQGAAAPTALN